MKILILCSGNSCRSQMAEGFLRSFDNCSMLPRTAATTGYCNAASLLPGIETPAGESGKAKNR